MTPMERAKADVRRMETDINRLRTQISVLQARMMKAQGYIEMAAIYEADEQPQQDAGRAKMGASAVAVRAAVEAIIANGAPMHTREILRELTKKGIAVGGSNPVTNLSGFLSRSDELRSSRTDGWGLAQWGEPMDEGKSDQEEESAEEAQEEEEDHGF